MKLYKNKPTYFYQVRGSGKYLNNVAAIIHGILYYDDLKWYQWYKKLEIRIRMAYWVLRN